MNGQPVTIRLADQVNNPRLWPTPKSSPSGPDFARAARSGTADDLATAVARLDTGPLNPEWVEWLMGCPIGWTDLKSSETASSFIARFFSQPESWNLKGC